WLPPFRPDDNGRRPGEQPRRPPAARTGLVRRLRAVPLSLRLRGRAPQYFCNLDVALDHPPTEEGIRYDVDVTYPAAATEGTVSRFMFCTCDGRTASCEQ
ncbi:MAG: hypothetical protein ACRDYF_12360, partial [Acidimicrobiia bacterium]